MSTYSKALVSYGLVFAAVLWAGDNKGKHPNVSLWHDPGSIAARNLIFGSGGQAHTPRDITYTFVEEDLDGFTPKFVVRGSDGVKWKVKLGEEARPETVATRLIWAIGFFTDEDYFLPSRTVANMPSRLSRGGEYVSTDGTVSDSRWERMEPKLGRWRWTNNPFNQSRELDGLRVLMALINNVDMKDAQNAIYERDGVRCYAVSDLGATFGQSGSRWPQKTKKGDLEAYSRSPFVTKVTAHYVNFGSPSWPMMFGAIPAPPLPFPLITAPVKLFGRPTAPDLAGQQWIRRGVPLDSVRWVAALLQKLSPEQIRDAFRAAHYSSDKVEGFSQIVERRIAELQVLRAGEQ